MAADYVIKRNDTAPPIVAVLKDQNGPIDLTNAEKIHIYLKPTTGSIIKTSACSVVSAVGGEVKYEWEGPIGEDPADLSTAGTYQGEFEITWKSGKVQTVPNAGYFTLEVVADLGP